MRHDYKQSFKAPFVYNETIPFFETHSKTIIGKDSLRLASSITGQRGGIWAKEKNPHKEWEVELQLRVDGRDEIGGEGMAFWYTRGRGVTGQILGNGDKWDGLMVGFDSYDNKKEKKNPFIMGILNDGKLELSKEPDWTTKVFDGCYRDFRNTEGPVYTKIRYQANELTVSVDTLRQGSGYSVCFSLPNIELPSGYYFGVTGAAGKHPDDHDILALETWELRQGVKEEVSRIGGSTICIATHYTLFFFGLFRILSMLPKWMLVSRR
ncbi:the carbohydrate recognition domain of complex with Mcfd2 [Piptocephalis cylindrospora]|uniref:The carbohydrate recognition domain of complex with Mcfd2 n=1 Tax=Piptocephalis cylindrospora TaxID=1907219 RepID=A0A4P9Y8Y6_9FUNG|nr:the carbohydrate recognition domain of complex with Mcfd2 [Piptocephalis cylindrospora]|eukprot:RKP14450.1 the carbohydrate recognition domain of complex with Mcfd2 [Piptocephalis cylindrospora]